MSESARDADMLAAQGPNPEREAYLGELRTTLEGSVDALPEAYRSVFVLRDVEGLSTAETAECLELSADVVKTRLVRARAQLRRSILERAGLASRDLFPFHAPRCNRVVAAVMTQLRIVPN